jgi:hypothetical protein
MIYQFRYRFIGFDGFQPLSADRFIGLGTGLPIIPIGKLVILTDLPIFDFSNVKFKFRAILTDFMSFCGNGSYRW